MGGIDEYLRSFVRWAEQEVPEGEMGITFTASGLVITGFMVSEDAYFEGLGRRHDVLAGRLEEVFGRQDDPQGAPRHVHLKDAKIVRGEGGPVTVGWWRERLESVDGFTLYHLDA